MECICCHLPKQFKHETISVKTKDPRQHMLDCERSEENQSGIILADEVYHLLVS
jgi:hypothetical protein